MVVVQNRTSKYTVHALSFPRLNAFFHLHGNKFQPEIIPEKKVSR
jgi:hypothetical protein